MPEREAWSKILSYCEPITTSAQKYGIDPETIATLIYYESRGDANDINPVSGATGLMQIIPRDSKYQPMCVEGPCFADRPTTNQLLDPEFNIDYGSWYLSTRVEYWGSLREGLFHYGPVDVGYTYADTIIETSWSIINE